MEKRKQGLYQLYHSYFSQLKQQRWQYIIVISEIHELFLEFCEKNSGHKMNSLPFCEQNLQ